MQLAARLEQAEVESRAAAAGAHSGVDDTDPKLNGLGHGGALSGPGWRPAEGGAHSLADAPPWALHCAVAVAAVAVRWWLLHEADPLQRKVLLVILWPVGPAVTTSCSPPAASRDDPEGSACTPKGSPGALRGAASRGVPGLSCPRLVSSLLAPCARTDP
jgi:hypothetical protein